MKKHLIWIVSLGAILISIPFFTNATPSTKKTGENYIIKALKIPNGIHFAGEEIPLHNIDVKERVDKEFLVNTYWQSNGLLLIKRAHKFFPIIEPILKKNNIPNDFKYLAVIESGLQNVTSPAGAKGFWQLMPATAREYGLEVNDNVDERYDLEKATNAACQYILKAKEKFGTWTAAAASYNIGINGLDRRMEEQMVTSYYDVLLPDETSRYLPRIIAIKEILSKPYDYGFVYDKNDLYVLPKYRTVKVDTAITNIAGFAQNFNTNYKELKILNPWLRENELNNRSRKPYKIKIPVTVK
ncbi:lytic transglycosylase domain-containing protein [Wenyingzhuangia sp. chi5]|uniref:Lytic transglycosylase domain-containing protein n=1 Tax=Wenyingzhuangia gilva TaxID=3057677 RepID=A0ABT8VRH3_9FLAO|nr:lytic transglycosylase domain-containing protein [Wenyingzhuangia sp. chi5]MDO3694574.1 lytic transglycosylase domain-containing protein [Wenyingzhuangia sp. chi5]